MKRFKHFISSREKEEPQGYKSDIMRLSQHMSEKEEESNDDIGLTREFTLRKRDEKKAPDDEKSSDDEKKAPDDEKSSDEKSIHEKSSDKKSKSDSCSDTNDDRSLNHSESDVIVTTKHKCSRHKLDSGSVIYITVNCDHAKCNN